jgi:glycosyltransferase involved in cell wall biosynthesis
MSKPRLLFIAPLMPNDGGNGLALRSGVFLDAFRSDHDVDLVVLPVAGGPQPTAFAQARCRRLEVIPVPAVLDAHASLILRMTDPVAQAEAWERYPRPSISSFNPGLAWQALKDRLDPFSYDLIFIQRLFSAPLVEPLLAHSVRPPILLDLDDDEMESNDRLASLYVRRGDLPRARIAAADARKFASLAARYFPAVERVLVCSERDRARLGARYPDAGFVCVPNAAPLAGSARRKGRPTDILLVGNLRFMPNTDAAEWLVREVLPRLGRVTATLVGSNAPEVDVLAKGNSRVRIAGRVDDLAPYYDGARIAVAPLQTGGGTRIKILEAFAHGVPVVATTQGAEGLDVIDGTHLLIADDPHAFAAQCRRLLDDEALAASLARNAREWLSRHATREIVASCIQRLAEELRQAPPG